MSVWFDAAWHPNTGFENLTKTSGQTVLINRDPFLYTPGLGVSPLQIESRSFAKNVITLAIDYWMHTFILLTDLPDEARLFMEYYAEIAPWPQRVRVNRKEALEVCFPPPNLIVGTRVTVQADVERRVPALWRTMAAKRMLIYDPRGPIDLCGVRMKEGYVLDAINGRAIDWLVVDALTTKHLDINWVKWAVTQCSRGVTRIPTYVNRLGEDVYDGAMRYPKAVLQEKYLDELPPSLRMRDKPEMYPDQIPAGMGSQD